MLPEYKKKTNIGIGLGIITFVVCVLLVTLVSDTSKEAATALGGTIGPLSSLLLIYGFCCYAKGKGYHGAWGLLGLLTIIGLIILVCFPDRHKPKDEQKE
jgi:hypothetical protein